MITGDLINENPEDSKILARILSKIKKTIITYAIFGKFHKTIFLINSIYLNYFYTILIYLKKSHDVYYNKDKI